MKDGFCPMDGARKRALLDFCAVSGLKFKDLSLLDLALTHSSAANEQSAKIDNERLEFLGDSILGAVSASLLYRIYAGKREGALAKIKSVVVSEDVLCGMARELKLDDMLLLGRGEERSGGRTKNALLGDAFEAVVGAFYLDRGYKAVFRFLEKRLEKEIVRVAETGYHRDYKSLLQEFCQRKWQKRPIYHCVKGEGADHDRTFWVEVVIEGTSYGPCPGRNKKTAEQEAAERAYKAVAKQG